MASVALHTITHQRLKYSSVQLCIGRKSHFTSPQYIGPKAPKHIELPEDIVSGIEKRMDAMTSETEFQPNPNVYNCRWCPYKPVEKGGTGHCSVGV